MNRVQITEQLIVCLHASLIEGTICRICCLLIQHPVAVCSSCGYYACKSCIKQWLSSSPTSQCPQKCSHSAKFLEKSIPQLETALRMIRIKCPYSEDLQQEEDPAINASIRVRCKQVSLKYEEIDKHVSECEYQLIDCDNSTCHEKIVKKYKINHMRICEECEVICEHCKTACTKKTLATHLLECPAREVVCENCANRFQEKKRPEHDLYHCPQRQISCPECQAIVIAINLQKHQSSLCPKRVVVCETCKQKMKVESQTPHASDEHCIQALARRIYQAEAQKELLRNEIKDLLQSLR